MWLVYLWLIGSIAVFAICSVGNVLIISSLAIRNEKGRCDRIVHSIVAVLILAAVTSVIGLYFLSLGEVSATELKVLQELKLDASRYWWAEWRYWVISPAVALIWIGLPIWYYLVANKKYRGFLAGGLAGDTNVH